MIRVQVERRADRSISAFKVDGHANFAESGEDIVCAGVSSVTVGTVNAVEALLGIELPADMREGRLHVRVPEAADAATREKTQLLIESMLVMLATIRDQYGKFVKIIDDQP